ncbi:TRAP transporter small permease [uncultured Cohaesibacter sp.]|uniref:TRAP transporter small permease n=1 Tax=uncultured Cohaesibacter sp. TaxID=1002546 RepID=UPI0029C7618D|nr:TRAP transporter small permease [uncultured Cohaesibacter sp.]
MLRKLLQYSEKFEEVMSVILFSLLVILCFMQVAFRFVINFSLSWTEELANYDFILLVYISCSLCIQKGAHVRVEIIDLFVVGRGKYWLDQALDLVWTVFIFAVGWHAVAIAEDALMIGKTTPALDWPYGWVYSIIPFTFALMTLRLIQRLVVRHQLWAAKQEHL